MTTTQHELTKGNIFTWSYNCVVFISSSSCSSRNCSNTINVLQTCLLRKILAALRAEVFCFPALFLGFESFLSANL